ncbi:addiction module toxin, HicA family [Candidatus Kaiserbacteria bacterium]|nr:addiction module toxin, HicA family [Candidatus Kaiserbacteria bacterium]
MSTLPILSARETMRRLIRLGFRVEGYRGSHAILVHDRTGRETTVPMHPGDLGRKLLSGIIKQSGVNLQDFLSA